jgi:hypothetical protein
MRCGLLVLLVLYCVVGCSKTPTIESRVSVVENRIEALGVCAEEVTKANKSLSTKSEAQKKGLDGLRIDFENHKNSTNDILGVGTSEPMTAALRVEMVSLLRQRQADQRSRLEESQPPNPSVPPPPPTPNEPVVVNPVVSQQVNPPPVPPSQFVTIPPTQPGEMMVHNVVSGDYYCWSWHPRDFRRARRLLRYCRRRGCCEWVAINALPAPGFPVPW